MRFLYKKEGFTLAEVLITLLVTGIIASLTIPALINNINDAQYKTTYRKAFTVASQSWQLALNDNLLVPLTDWGDNTANNINFLAFMSKFNTAKQCLPADNTKCWANGEKYWGCPQNDIGYAFIDSSGMAWSRAGNTTDVGGDILVDTNGNRRPNQYGKDRFAFIPVLPNGTNGWSISGLHTKIKALSDSTSQDNACQSPPCFFTSWLKQ